MTRKRNARVGARAANIKDATTRMEAVVYA